MNKANSTAGNESNQNKSAADLAAETIVTAMAGAKNKPAQKEEKEKEKDESVSSNIKRICYERKIFKPDGFLDPQALYQAFKEKILDVEDFKAALKWVSKPPN